MCEQNQKSQATEGFGSAAMKQQAEIPPHVRQERARQMEANLVEARNRERLHAGAEIGARDGFPSDGVCALLTQMVVDRLAVYSADGGVDVSEVRKFSIRRWADPIVRAMEVKADEAARLVLEARQERNTATRDELLQAILSCCGVGVFRVDGDNIVKILSNYRQKVANERAALGLPRS